MLCVAAAARTEGISPQNGKFFIFELDELPFTTDNYNWNKNNQNIYIYLRYVTMVTFNCEVCNATVPKKNTEKHYYRCPNAYYTCIDCSKTFEDGVSYKQHTSCISEDEKYQKALYKGSNGKAKNKQAGKVEKPAPKKAEVKKTEPKKAAPKKDHIKLNKGDTLYSILKTLKDKDAKKKFLKSLVVDDEGRLSRK